MLIGFAMSLPGVEASQGPLTGDPASLTFRGAGSVGVFEPGAVLFSDRDYKVAECPEWLIGKPFLRNNIDLPEHWVVTEPGILTVLTPVNVEKATSQIEALEKAGFEHIKQPDQFQLFGQDAWNQCRIYQKQVVPGERFELGKYVVPVGFSHAEQHIEKPWSENAGERLYNGIVLPEEWPPRNIDVNDHTPMPVPYLDLPPPVIPIDVGRQLFVDDFLIAETTLSRSFHAPIKYEGNPVLKAETPIELGLEEAWGQSIPYDMELYHNRARAPFEPPATGHARPYGHGNAVAAPKSGGCWWDPEDQVFKLWYEASWFGPIAMAVSKDGIHWERPEFDILPGTNIVSPMGITPDSWTVVPNWNAENPNDRWTLYVQSPGHPQPAMRLTSPDGIHWKRRAFAGIAGDRTTHHFNPFRNKWIFSIRAGFHGEGVSERGRARRYYETSDFLEDATWQPEDPVRWLMADEEDKADYMIGDRPQLYNFDAVPYESIMLGLFQIHLGPINERGVAAGYPKITELMYAFSRDGFHYDRPDRKAHISASRGDFWDRGYVQSLGNICVIHRDKLYFYYAAWAGNPEKAGMPNGLYDNGATGLAILRRDGFASMDAGEKEGALTTRPVTFSGKRLFVNLDAPEGMLRVEVLDKEGNPIEPFTMVKSIPVRGDSTLEAVTWEGGADLSALAGQPVRFRFELTNGSLYAFWVSKDESGRSDGYLAGGGPGYIGPTDTVGRAALR